MDTRSVVRSCRRSSRLTGQPPHEERVRQAITGKRRHHSDHDTPVRTNTNASRREGSCPQIGSHSKTSSSHDAYLETPQIDATNATDATDAIASVRKTEQEDPVFPLSPNLRSSETKATGSSRAETGSITVSIEDPIKTSEDAVKDHVTTKWVKTARGSIRLASDSPAEGSKSNECKRSDENEEAHNVSFETTRRRSRRLASMTPDVAGDTIEVKPISSRHTVGKTKSVPTKSREPDAAGDSAEQESESDLPGPSTRAMSEHDHITHPIPQEEFLIHDENPERLLQDPDDFQNSPPIPELVADIERIIQSSPMADRYSADDSTKHTSASTPTKALKKQAPSIMATRSRTLRSSSRSVESTSNIAKRPGSDLTDSESSQLDGAFDDSIRGRKKKARVAGDPANTFKPSELRGTKRSAKKLSQDEGSVDTPAPRQRRKPNGGGSKPEEDLNSANPIERATSRDSFQVDDPEIEDPLNISEFVRRSDEPVNPIMLAQMISTNQERADSDIDSTAAEYGGDSDSIAAESGSGIDSMAAEYGSQASSRLQSPDGDTYKCADCGMSPKRYLVCAKCKEAIYCGKYCQIWNWPLHKTRCLASDEADQAEIETQEAYLEDTWAAALEVLKEEKMAGGTVESLLLGEAVRHTPTRPAFMGQGSPRGFVAFDVGASQSAERDAESVDRARVMSMRLAQAALGGEQ